MMLAPWNEEAWRSLHDRRQRDTLPHALLLGGPAGLGKRAFAGAFAKSLMCTAIGADGHACGVCRACLLLAAGTHPDLVQINLELRDDGKSRTEITVDQMRALSERFTLTSQFGGRQVALIDPADAMNVSASNALLKTLEEPTQGTIIILVADHPARLSATIRSRCQRIDLRLPRAELAMRWLRLHDVDDKLARDALLASDGNPGLALAWSHSGAMKLRSDVEKDLRELNAGVAAAHEVAQRWSRDEVDLRLRFAASLVQQQGRAQAHGARALSAGGPLALTAAVDLPKLTAWFDQANRTREWLRGPLRAELSLLELLSAWTAASTRERATGPQVQGART
jgi:DNA polymerase III subunit delta'